MRCYSLVVSRASFAVVFAALVVCGVSTRASAVAVGVCECRFRQDSDGNGPSGGAINIFGNAGLASTLIPRRVMAYASAGECAEAEVAGSPLGKPRYVVPCSTYCKATKAYAALLGMMGSNAHYWSSYNLMESRFSCTEQPPLHEEMGHPVTLASLETAWTPLGRKAQIFSPNVVSSSTFIPLNSAVSDVLSGEVYEPLLRSMLHANEPYVEVRGRDLLIVAVGGLIVAVAPPALPTIGLLEPALATAGAALLIYRQPSAEEQDRLRAKLQHGQLRTELDVFKLLGPADHR